ncbi:MAG: O-antigen ligase family protein [Sphingomonadaceae bacterium]
MIRGQYDIGLGLFIALCLFLGGSSGGGLIGNLILQLLAVCLIVGAALAKPGSRTVKPQPLLHIALAFMALVALIQFVPLPSTLWPHLPGRAFLAEGYDLLGINRPWLTLSLAPFNSLASLAWLLPALATGFLASRLLDLKSERIAIAICLVAVVSIPLAAVQFIGGQASGWYLYPFSYGQGAGFFSNGNHQGTFLLIAIPMMAALSAHFTNRPGPSQTSLRLFFSLLLLVLVAGVIMTGSMAAMGLLLVVLPASYLIMTPRVELPGQWVLLAGGLAGLALVLGITYAVGEQVGSGLAEEGPMSRPAIAMTTLAAAWTYFPFGSGIGTFEDVYRMFEDPGQVTTTFINHAHNDYLEILLETGLGGLIAMVLFLLWWTRRSLQLWTGERKHYFALAASLSVGVVLAHSVVDYPLRTASVSVLFALSVALMARDAGLWSRPRTEHRSNRSKKKKITL